MIRNGIIVAIASLCVAGALYDLAFPLRPKLLYNPSLSADIGWYNIGLKTEYTRGDQIAVFAPLGARNLAHERDYLPFDYPLIKSVWASSGDEVCAKGLLVSGPNGSVMARLSQDRLGRDMPLWSGCITLKKGQYFIASPSHAAGWDSRYFGPVSETDILGTASYLGKKGKDGKQGNEAK